MPYQANTDLLRKLPPTFVPALNEQFRNWDLLFPAERRTISAQMDWLGHAAGRRSSRPCSIRSLASRSR